jgi:hypothetical protein
LAAVKYAELTMVPLTMKVQLAIGEREEIRPTEP